MRTIIVILSAFLCHCAKDRHEAVKPEGCSQFDVMQVEWPDGVERKSAVYFCKSGCAIVEDAENAESWYLACK